MTTTTVKYFVEQEIDNAVSTIFDFRFWILCQIFWKYVWIFSEIRVSLNLKQRQFFFVLAKEQLVSILNMIINQYVTSNCEWIWWSERTWLSFFIDTYSHRYLCQLQLFCFKCYLGEIRLKYNIIVKKIFCLMIFWNRAYYNLDFILKV